MCFDVHYQVKCLSRRKDVKGFLIGVLSFYCKISLYIEGLFCPQVNWQGIKKGALMGPYVPLK